MATSAEKTCSNCRGPKAPLKCGVCKKTFYCSGPCQREDWPFHKRTCTKPSEKESSPSELSTTPVVESPITPAADTAVVSTPVVDLPAESAAAPSPVATPPAAGPTPTTGDDDLYDEEDRAAMAAVKKMGYR